MKKMFFLIIICIFMFPILTNALDEEWRRWSTLNDEIYCADNSATNIYGTEVTYSNGLYHVGGTTGTDLVFRWSYGPTDYDYVYTCKKGDVTECANVYLVFRSVRCHGFNNRVGVKLVGGATYENQQSFYIGDGYTKENGVYTLKNAVSHPFTEMTNESYISDTYKYKYMCEGYGKTCNKAWILFSVINPVTGKNYLAGVDVEDYYLMSDQYIIEDDHYVIIDPKIVYPVLETGSGYSCHNHDTTCTTLYRLTIDEEYDNHDGRRAVYDLLTINKSEKHKTLSLRSGGNVNDFFTNEELKKSFSTNTEIANIDNANLLLYRVGNTDIIYEDDIKYKVMHLRVKNDGLINNPKTGSSLIIILIVTCLCVLGVKFHKMLNNN